MHILVVDDDPAVGAAMAQQLEKLSDITVTLITNPTDADQWLTANRADLILVDHVMPDIDGIEFIRNFRSRQRDFDVPMLILTGRDDHVLLRSAIEAGANDFVRKPIEPAELLARASNMLKLRAQTRALLETLARLEELATTDPLTNVYNRRSLLHRLEEECKRAGRHGHRVSVMMIDVDHFKQVNDRYGHAAGDRLLEELTAICRQQLRASDFLGRTGGEEFVIGLPHTPLDGAATLADRIRQHLAETPVHFDGKTIAYTVSIGVGEREDKEEVRSLLARTDRALYCAKNGGRNHVSIAQGSGKPDVVMERGAAGLVDKEPPLP